jgi:glutamate N-acetyltransferase/amino-acid N-acetyltransferase
MKFSVPGFRAAGVHCGIKQGSALDLALIVSDRPGTTAAGVFTRSRFPSAPVLVSRPRLRAGRARAIVANSGCSNVARGAEGMRNAREMTALAARALGLRAREVLVASTGVIGRALPMPAIRSGIPLVAEALAADGWEAAARAIMTTDTRPKLARSRGRIGSFVGIAKGAGMIMPNMATMLAFVATDAAVEPAFLRDALRDAAEATFNRLTIDGESSTSDTLVVLANGASGRRPLAARSPAGRDFARALRDLCQDLVEQLAFDGEGVTRVADVAVSGARRDADALAVARSIGNSMLVKTALFGADPNWGRVVQAVGAAGVPLRARDVGVRFCGVEVLRRGEPIGGESAVERARRALARKRVAIEVSLGRGPGRAALLTTDLSYEYVRINAEYTT